MLKRVGSYYKRACLYVLDFILILPSQLTPSKKGPMDILVQTLRKEGFFALYKGSFLLRSVLTQEPDFEGFKEC